jgi:flagellin FlaB
MFNWKKLHRDENGQTALETAIILIAFVVVASVFAFAILSSGSKSTEKGQSAINAGLAGVESSMSVKGAMIAEGNAGGTAVDSVVFTLALVAGGDPVDMTDSSAGKNTVVIGYRDGAQREAELDWTVAWIGDNDADALLEEGELAEVTVVLSALTTPLPASTEFTVEIKPPKGAVIALTRTTPAAIEAVMEL